jgi:hypothetical protein
MNIDLSFVLFSAVITILYNVYYTLLPPLVFPFVLPVTSLLRPCLLVSASSFYSLLWFILKAFV